MDGWIGSIDLEQAKFFNFLNTPPREGVIRLPHPYIENKYVVLKILGSSSKFSMSMENGKLSYTVSVKIKTKFAEAQDQTTLDDAALAKIQERYDERFPQGGETDIFAGTTLTTHFDLKIRFTHKAINWI